MAESFTHWRDLFVGRRAELEWLADHWKKALAGEPQLVVLLAESGLGKTRIAQEFYRRLSREHDPAPPDKPQGYWPDSFATDSESLAVNPSFDSHAPTGGEIPWLWWGLRWQNPESRNTIDERCALHSFRNVLAIHTQAIELKKRRAAIGMNAAWTIAETAAGALIPLVFISKQILDLGKDLREARTLAEEASRDPSAQRRATDVTLKDLALRDFRATLDPGDAHAPTVPVILLLDDAQWADSTSLTFVRELFAEASRNGWKLLVIVTHWEREWNLAPVAVDPKDGSISHARQLPAALGLTAGWQLDCLRKIPPLPEAEDIVHQAFPGLTEAQGQLVVEKSGGNAEMLREALMWLEREPRFFERGDRCSALSVAGQQQLVDREFKLKQFIRERFARLELEVQRALGWSSLQGNRFQIGRAHV